MTAPAAPSVPPCGLVGCADPRKTHKHEGWVRGLRVVVEAKRPSAPGWAWTSPHGTITSTWPYQMDARETVTVEFDDAHRAVPVDLLTRYHTWRRRKPPVSQPKLLPRLPRTHVIDHPDVDQPPLFPEAS